jgi:hypothetical protein
MANLRFVIHLTLLLVEASSSGKVALILGDCGFCSPLATPS